MITTNQSYEIIDDLDYQSILKKIERCGRIAYKSEEKKIDVKRKTQQLLTKYHLDGAVGNTLAGFGAKDNEILMLTKKGKSAWKKGKKEELASSILDMIK